MPLNFIKSEVVSNQKLNYKFHSIRFKAFSPFDFKIGQFVTLKVTDKIFRSYSIASTPGQLPYWEMFVDITPNGPGTQFLSRLTTRDIIETTTPRGNFILEETSNPLVFVITGCGFASIKPMIEESLRAGKEVYLFWGLRYIKDIVLEDFLGTYQKNYPNFHYEIILSHPEGRWKGKSGHVTEHLCETVKKLKERRPNIYLCGNGAMIADINKSLVQFENCYDKIHFEKYYQDGKEN